MPTFIQSQVCCWDKQNRSILFLKLRLIYFSLGWHKFLELNCSTELVSFRLPSHFSFFLFSTCVCVFSVLHIVHVCGFCLCGSFPRNNRPTLTSHSFPRAYETTRNMRLNWVLLVVTSTHSRNDIFFYLKKRKNFVPTILPSL